jgi:hypothetical protein
MKDNPTPPDNQDDPFATMTKELQEQNTLSKAAADNRDLSDKLQNQLLNDSVKLSNDQRKSMEEMVRTLQSKDPGDLEQQKEARAHADKVLEALEGILSNTEDLGKISGPVEGASAVLLAIPIALLALGAGFAVGVAESFAKIIKVFTKVIFKAVNAITKLFGIDLAKIGKGLGKSITGFTKGIGASIKGLGTGASARIAKIADSIGDVFKPLTKGLTNIKKAFGAGFAGLKTFRTATGQFGKVGLLGKLGGLFQSLTKPFKAIGSTVKSIKDFVLTPLKSAGSSLKTIKSALPSGGMSKGLKPLMDGVKRVLRLVKSVGTFAGTFGRVLGRLFLPITVIMSLFDTFKGAMSGFEKYSEKGFLEGIIGGLFGGISGLLTGLIGLPLDLLKDGISWIAGKLGFDNFSETLDSFSFSELIGQLFTSITDTIVGFIGNIKDSIADIGIGGLIQNVALNLLKIFKKIVTFPHAVAAGAIGAVANLFGDPVQGFQDGFNKVFTLGDSAIDSMKVQGDGMNEKGEEIKSMSGENELEKSSAQPTVVSAVSAVTSDNSVKRGGDTYVMSPSKPNRSREALASR